MLLEKIGFRVQKILSRFNQFILIISISFITIHIKEGF